MGSQCVLLMADTKHSTIGVIAFMRGGYGKEVQIAIKGSYIEVYSGIEFPKHDFQFNHDTNCRIYVAILHHSGLSYNMF